MPSPTVFISYSHKDEKWKDRLIPHLGVLEKEGFLDLWDDRRIVAGEDWYKEIEEAIKKANIAILLVTANFLTSKFILSEEIPRLLQRRDTEGLKIFPIIAKPCAWQEVKWLTRMQVRPRDGKPLSGGRPHQVDADLATIASEIAGIIRRVEKKTSEVPETSEVWKIPPDKISLAKLPSTSPDLFGRKEKLKQLDDAWNNQDINVLSLVAWGGVGKSALVNKWLSQMARDNYRGAERVFGWSFYSQGAAEGRQVSADQFIASALAWFGDPDPMQGSAWDKGERLAELIKQQRTLLILDGLEPLQNPPPVETGKIKDPGLTSLLRELARQNPGLVVITTRLTVDDLKDFKDNAALEIDLENLSAEAGAKYLEYLNVKGLSDELEKAVTEFGGHALALTLLGRYLSDVYDGDIRKRDLIPNLTEEEEKGGHAKRILQAYKKWFEDKPEREILYLMGLFDRPAQKGAIDALLAEPAIDGLTNKLQDLPTEKYKLVLKHLRQARLLTEPDPHEPDTLDCHPLLREHFGEKLKAENSNAWRDAHERLYEYYKSSAKEYPDTIEEMAPLYAAVMHGCQAGQYLETLDKVYTMRIRRWNDSFSTKRLGALGADLVALSEFFDPPWDYPNAELTIKGWRGFLLSEAGGMLRALGRLAEATQPTQASLEVSISEEDWRSAATTTSNLSELYLTIGEMTQAVNYARQSVELADRNGEMDWRMASRTALADSLHQAGRLAEAKTMFDEAEDIQKNWQPQLPLLYSYQGFQYCDLLISQGKYQEVQSRANQTLEWYRQTAGASLHAIALDYLSLRRTQLFQLQHDPNRPISHSLNFLNRAVEGLRQAGDQELIARGLLARAEFYRVTGTFDKAQKDLDEAFSIATRGGMGLYLADCHLEYARLYLAKGDKVKAREHWEIAKKKIDEMGYHRRDKEVEEIESSLRGDSERSKAKSKSRRSNRK